MRKLYSIKFKPVPILLLLFALLNAFTAAASHFRFGLITATRIGETATTVTYRLNVSTSWRLGSTSAGYYTISGGNTGTVNIPMSSVTDPSGEWTNATGTATVTLNKTSTPTKISWVSGAKIGEILNNANGNWDVYVILNTANPGSSPVSSLPAVINMPVNAAAATYTIPVSDPDPGSTFTFGTPFSISSALSSQTNPTGFSLNTTTGQITLNTVGKTVGQLYNAMVTVTDNHGNHIMLDFIIKMVGASTAPAFDYGVTPANGQVYNVIAGQNISFPIKATDVDAGSTVGLSVSGLPAYITTSNFSPAMPATGNPSQTTFSWTPTAAQIGNTVVLNFIATDNVGVQTTTSVTIKVAAEPAPVFVSPTPGEGTIRQIPTGVLHQEVIKAESSLGSNVSIAFANIPSGPVLSPVIPTPAGHPATTTLTWMPTPANWGVHDLSFQAVIASAPTIFTTRAYKLIVNTPPAFTSIPVTTVKAGESYTYHITVSDPDLPYGDQLDIITNNLPSWLTLTDNGNGTATLTGTPSMANGGLHSIHLHAEDIHHHGYTPHVEQAFTINVETCAISLDATTTDVTCNGGNNGAIHLTVNNAAAPVQFSWKDANNNVVSTVEDPSSLSYGTYTVNVLDANGCTQTTSATINQLSAIAINALGTTTFCDGGSVKLSLPVNSNVIGFDDLPNNGAPIPNPYKGFVWTTDFDAIPMYYLNGTQRSNDGYHNGTISPDNVAYNPYGYTQSSVRSVNGAFHYKGAYFTSAWYNQNLTFYGYLNGNVVYTSQTYSITTTTPVFIQLDWANIDKLEIISTNAQWAMDDFTVGSGAANPTGIWYKNNAPIPGATSEQLDATATGTYTFVSTSGCSSNTIQVTVNSLPEFTVAKNNVTCAGGTDGAITVSATGGSGDYTYSSDGGASYQSSNTFTDLATGTYSIVVKDAAGCTASEDVSIIQEDLVKPTVLTQPVIVLLDAQGKGSISAADVDHGSSDNCGIASMSLDKTNFTCSDIGGNEVTLTVEDVNGNIHSATAMVTVKDEVKPTVVTQNITVQLDASGNASISAAQINNGSSDACGIASYSLSKSIFDCSNVGSNQVTLSVTDIHNNVTTATATVTVEDKIAPLVVTRPVTVHLDAQGNGTIAEYEVNNSSSDACGGLTFETDINSFNCSNINTPVTVTLTVTDANGNSATGTALVTVVDEIKPTVKTKPVTVALVGGVAIITPQMVDDGSWDACGIASISVNETSFTCDDIGNHTVTLTVTDVNGNTNTGTAVVTIEGVIPSPSITVSRANTTFTGPNTEKTIFLGYGAQSLNLAASDATTPAATIYNWSPASFLNTASGATTTYSPDASEDGENTITVTATNQYGCEASKSVNITVVDARCGNDLTKVNMCHQAGNDPTHVKTICIDGGSVQDHLKKGCKIGACLEAGTVTSGVETELSTGSFALKAMPNPSTASFTLKVETSNLTDRVVLRVMDIKGRLVEMKQNIQPNQTLRIGDHYRPGIYFVEVMQGTERTQTKLIKMGN